MRLRSSIPRSLSITLRPRQNGRRFAHDTLKRIFFNENVRISIKISLKFVPKGPNNNIPTLVQIMAWRRPGHKPLSETMLVSLPTHICVTRPQWVNTLWLRQMAAILQMTLSNSFSWLKIVFWFRFHWNLFPVIQQMIGLNQEITHYLNQWWSISLTHIIFTHSGCFNEIDPDVLCIFKVMIRNV